MAMQQLVADPTVVVSALFQHSEALWSELSLFAAGMKSTISGLALVGGVLSQTCNVNNVRTTPPTNGTNVALQSYSYCGGSLNVTAYVANLDYDKILTVYYTNRQNESTPLSELQLGYQSDAVSGQIEIWGGSNTEAYIDGVDELLNITFQATDIGETYYQILDLAVTASGAPEPTLAGPPAPYATPIGLGNDITQWLSVYGANTSEAVLAFERMFLNINPAVPGAVKGVVVAARSGPSYEQKMPDYEYNWVRDESLTMDVVQTLYAAATKRSAKSAYETILFEYAAARAYEQVEPGLQTGLGEPKFYLNNTIFTGPWGRPQNDGPATAAITLMEFANDYLAAGGSLSTVRSNIWNAPVREDLIFVAQNWSYPSFDLWEEESSDHFYTRMVQRRALLQGAEFAKKMGESNTSSVLSASASALSATFSDFWDPNRQILLYEYGPVLHDKTSYLDIAVVLGVIHGYNNDGFYSYTNDEVLSTALRIATSFLIYPIAATTRDSDGQVLGIPIGRYPEDVYNGVDTSENGGNPWYLCTNAMAQFMYSAVSEYRGEGSIKVSNVSEPFFTYFAPSAGLKAGSTYRIGTSQFRETINSLEGWGDAFVRRNKYETPADGRLSEEYNRNTGAPQGAADLTWSYASLLTAAFARSSLTHDYGYVRTLANLGVSNNTAP